MQTLAYSVAEAMTEKKSRSPLARLLQRELTAREQSLRGAAGEMRAAGFKTSEGVLSDVMTGVTEHPRKKTREAIAWWLHISEQEVSRLALDLPVGTKPLPPGPPSPAWPLVDKLTEWHAADELSPEDREKVDMAIKIALQSIGKTPPPEEKKP